MQVLGSHGKVKVELHFNFSQGRIYVPDFSRMLFLLFFVGTVSLAFFMTSTLGYTIFTGYEHFFVDFAVSLLRIIGQTLYIIIGFLFELLNQLVVVGISIFPTVWKIVTIVISFLIWVGRQVLKGIFGTGNVFLTAISWVFCLCIFCLWTEKLFASVTSNEVDDNNRNMIREVNRRMEYENQENENEENSIEEAEINMATEDNDRNTVRELEHRQTGQGLLNREPAGTAVFHGERLIVRLPETTRKSVKYIQIKGNDASDNSDTESYGSSCSSDEEVEEVHGSQNQSRNSSTIFRRRRRRNDSIEDSLCVVCFDSPRNTAVFPCGHLQFCTQCVASVMRERKCCPVCQLAIEEYRKVYL